MAVKFTFNTLPVRSIIAAASVRGQGSIAETKARMTGRGEEKLLNQ